MPRLSSQTVYDELSRQYWLEAEIPSLPPWTKVSNDALENLQTAMRIAIYCQFAYPKLVRAQSNARNAIARITG